MLYKILCKIRKHKFYPVGKINGLSLSACSRCGKTIVDD